VQEGRRIMCAVRANLHQHLVPLHWKCNRCSVSTSCKQLLWYQLPCRRHDVKSSLQNLVKIYNADAQTFISTDITKPNVGATIPHQPSLALTSRVSRTNFKIYMKYIFAVTHETAGAEDGVMRYGKPTPYFSHIFYVLYKY